jgi:trypsin-like peptidase
VPFFEPAVDAALVLVRAADGRVLGTGFLADDRGTVLTCHHVVDGVDGQAGLRLELAGGTPLDCLGIEAVPEHDIALLRTEATGARPLPLAADERETFRFWAKGFHRIGGSVHGAFPVEGTSIGTTAIGYRTAATTYRLDEVTVLRRDAFDPGLSGAPVLDPETGAVVALVVGKQKTPGAQEGYALPIRAARRAEPVALLVRRNRFVAPAFGRHLNPAGARELCIRQSGTAREDLAERARIDLDRHIGRSAFEERLDAFLAAGEPVLAVVGPSGNGKSTELARIAARYPAEVVLLSAALVDPSSRDVSATIADVLGTRGGPDALAAALREDGRRLLVVLDGLNEAPAQLLRKIDVWIQQSVSWVRRSEARLVLSCRPEYWEAFKPVFPAGALYHVAGDDDGTGPGRAELWLDDLTTTETEAAMLAYGVPEVALDHRTARHPLMLRLYAELASGTSLAHRVRELELLDAYVDDRARTLARRLGKPVHRISAALEHIAATLAETGDNVIGATAYDEAFGSQEAADAAVSEHLFVRTPAGFRFAVDTVADALTARSDAVRKLLRPGKIAKLGAGKKRNMLGPLTFALISFGDEHGSARLRPLLEKLWSTALATDDVSLGEVVERVLADLADPVPCFDLLRELAVNAVAVAQFYLRRPAPSARPRRYLLLRRSADAEFWALLQLPPARRLSLLRILLRSEGHWGWREKDWVAGDRGFSVSGWRRLALRTVAADPVPAFRLLADWLDDATPISGDINPEARLGDVAQALMFENRTGHLGELCDVLATTANDGAFQLLRVLCRTDAAAMCHVVRRWATDGAPADHYAAARCCGDLPLTRLTGDDLRELVLGLRTLAAGAGDSRVRDNALAALLMIEETAAEYLPEALDRLRRGSPNFPAGLFGPSLAERGPEIVAAFEEVLDAGCQPFDAGSLLSVLITRGPPEVAAEGLRLARRQVSRPETVLSLSLNVERALYDGIPADEHPLVDATRFLFAWPSARRNLAYALARPQDDEGRDLRRAALFDDLVSVEDDEDNLAELVKRCTGNAGLRDAPRLLERLRLRLGAEELDHQLLVAAFWNTEFAAVFAGWLDTGLLEGSGSLARGFAELVEEGTDPHAAARRMLGLEG